LSTTDELREEATCFSRNSRGILFFKKFFSRDLLAGCRLADDVRKISQDLFQKKSFAKFGGGFWEGDQASIWGRCVLQFVNLLESIKLNVLNENSRLKLIVAHISFMIFFQRVFHDFSRASPRFFFRSKLRTRLFARGSPVCSDRHCCFFNETERAKCVFKTKLSEPNAFQLFCPNGISYEAFRLS
jgi:hypothetical protein